MRTILEHVARCNGSTDTVTTYPSKLKKEMHCICGFNCSNGNDLARHLASCERKSAYPTPESAQENTAKCNMLDMLGLVRRDGEEEEDSNEGLLIPANQQQQLLSKSLNREDSNNHKNDNTTGNAAGESQTTETQAKSQPISTQAEDFNTQISLDDLAPQSVAPQIEPDRTPQLSDEYQVGFNIY